MRKIFLIILIIAFLIPPTAARTITVCKDGCDHSVIQSAIDSAEERDMIIVEGEFWERLKISKSIILTGNATLFPGAGPGIRVSADDVIIKEFKIFGGYSGIDIINAQGVKIERCSFYGNSYGVSLSQASNCTITEVEFNNIINSAIKLEGSNSNVLSFNTINNSPLGIYLYKSSENNVTESSFTNLPVGILLEYALKNRIDSNAFSTNIIAISFYESGSNEISNNSADGDVLVDLRFSPKNTISYNTAKGIIAKNFDSERNDFILTNVNLTGLNFEFSLIKPSLPENYIALSDAINVTITPDIFTNAGYIYMESNLTEDEVKELASKIDPSTIAFYKLDSSVPEKVSEKISEKASEKVSEKISEGFAQVSFTSKQSGIYVLAGEKAKRIPSFELSLALLAIAYIAYLTARRKKI
jgi:parallel beta-helix repeat protein